VCRVTYSTVLVYRAGSANSRHNGPQPLFPAGQRRTAGAARYSLSNLTEVAIARACDLRPSETKVTWTQAKKPLQLGFGRGGIVELEQDVELRPPPLHFGVFSAGSKFGKLLHEITRG
jgi:hypothetical protein